MPHAAAAGSRRQWRGPRCPGCGVGTHGDHLAAQLVEGGENLCVVGGRAGVVQAGVDFDAPTGLDGAAENLPDDVLVPVQADGLVIPVSHVAQGVGEVAQHVELSPLGQPEQGLEVVL